MALDPKFDLTARIIDYINKNPAKTKAPFTPKIPESTVGIMDTRLFFEQEIGINLILKNSGKYKNQQELCANTRICTEILNAMQAFSAKKEFSLLLDPSKPPGIDLTGVPTIDCTLEFIKEFNKNHK